MKDALESQEGFPLSLPGAVSDIDGSVLAEVPVSQLDEVTDRLAIEDARWIRGLGLSPEVRLAVSARLIERTGLLVETIRYQK
jgi:hypothetical protein